MSPYFFEIVDESSKPIIVGVDHSFWVTGNSGGFSSGCCSDMRWISKNHRFFWTDLSDACLGWSTSDFVLDCRTSCSFKNRISVV